MAEINSTYYVYVYIDPRNFEEFYYGKGTGSRKTAHLSDDSDTEKAKRIKAIKKEGLEPIIKVIARNLTESEAFLIEKTLIWKLGKSLLNISSGQFADKFRKHDTFHLDLAGFDFNNGLYYVNVGQGKHRCWEDCREFGFLSAGQGPKWSDPIRTLEIGDIVAAYLKNHGYVGIGRVTEKAVKVIDFKIDGKSLKDYNLKVDNIFENCENEKSEYPVKIQWIKTVASNQAKWKSRSKLFATQQIKASLQSQRVTRDFLETEFEISFKDLLLSDSLIAQHNKVEKVFEILGEGGGLCISRQKNELGEKFIYHHNEFDPSDEGLDVNIKDVYDNFEQPFQLINNQYPWYILHLSVVHNEFRNYIIEMLIEKLNDKPALIENFEYHKEDLEHSLNIKLNCSINQQTNNLTWTCEKLN